MTTLMQLLGQWMPAQRWFAAASSGGEHEPAVGAAEAGGPPAGAEHPRAEAPQFTYVGGYVLRDPQKEPGVRLITVALISHAPEGAVPVLYQVPLVLRDVDAKVPALGYIGSITDQTGSNVVVDGPHDPAFARALLDLIRSEQTARGVNGSPDVVAYGLPMPGARAGDYASSRVLEGEQSNTSIIYEMRGSNEASAAPLIIKVFRTVNDGENPDVTLQTALAAAGSLRVPPVLGNVSGEWPLPGGGDVRAAGHLAFAQEFLPGVEDAWRAALRAAETGDDFGEAAATLGEATSEVHEVLRHVMPTVEATHEHVERIVESMRVRAAEAISDVPELAEFAGDFEGVWMRAAGATWPALQRIHGDYHLGQVLGVPDIGWVLLDFEGEPLRPMSERNALDVPVRDLAGMLRSFDYVAGALSLQAGDDVARAWADRAREMFVAGYRVGLEARDVPTVQANALLDPALLAAFELDKALYEVRYEKLHRPNWLPIPVAAVKRLIGLAG